MNETYLSIARAQAPENWPLEVADEVIRFHPVTTGDAQVMTPAVGAVLATCVSVVSYREEGHGFIAPPRVGKTTAVYLVARALEAAFPEVCFIEVDAARRNDGNPGHFYRYWLYRMNGAVDRGLNHVQLRDTVRETLLRKLGRTGRKTIVILLDEAQKLSLTDLEMLQETTNNLRMDHRKIKLLTLFFAQPDFLLLRDKIERSPRIEFVPRFALRIHTMKGISTCDELKETLAQYDDYTLNAFPEGSSCAYTQAFLPQAFANGWRLAEEAERLWRAMADWWIQILDQQLDRAEMSFGMAYVAAAAQQFLAVQRDVDNSNFKADDKAWQDAVASSGHPEALSSLSRTLPRRRPD